MKAKRRTVGVLLLAMAILATIGMTVAQGATGPSRWLPGDLTIAPATGDQSSPDVAWGADTSLAVWHDKRAMTPTNGYEYETSSDIYGMRLDANGNPLEATPFIITDAPAHQENPKVAWNGANWLVMFETYRLTGTGYYYEKGFAFVRVSPSGQVLDPKPVPVYNGQPSGASYWDLAADGANWVLAFQGTAASGDIMAIRIGPDGTALDQANRSLVPATYYMRSNFHLACAAGVCLLTFNDDYVNGIDNTGAVRFDSNLNVLGGGLFTLNDRPLNDLASNGSGFYMIWTATNLYGSRVNTSGQKLDGNGVNISGSRTPTQGASGVVWDGTNWKAYWPYQGVAVARINTAGQVLDPSGVVVAGLTSGPAAVTSSGNLQLVWAEAVSSQNDVRAATISPSFAAGPVRTLSVGAPAQLHVDIATNGNGHLAVYRSEAVNRYRLVAQPLDAAGNPLTAEPVELAVSDGSSTLGAPAVAWNGSLYLVVWNNSQGVVGQRLAADGSKIDAAPFVIISPAFGRADVAALGDTFLVAGRQYGYTVEIIHAVGARVRGTDGAVLDPTPLMLHGWYYDRVVAVTTLGDRWLFVTYANFSHDESTAETVYGFVAADGTVTPATRLTIFTIAEGNGIHDIGLASNGSVALAAQSAEVTSGVETDLVGWLIQPSGAASSMINFTPWRDDQYRPRIAWDGNQFVMVYSDQRDSFAERELEQLDARANLMGMRVKADGSIVDPQGFVFSASPHAETHVNVASHAGASLVIGSILRPEPGLVHYRLGYTLFGGTNQWPVAQAAANPTGGVVPLSVSFSSAGSTDPDGTIQSYAWAFGDGATSTEANPTHTYAAPGPYVATLTVTDSGGAETTQTVLVKPVAANVPPVANANANPSSGAAPLDVTFTATGSYDPDGAIGNIKWTFHDGSTYWGETAYHTYNSTGAYVVTLEVTDAAGAVGTDTVTVSVGSTPPTSTPTPTPTVGPTNTPTRTPTVAPATNTPTRAPTATPRGRRTSTPTPTRTPTVAPTATPTTGSGPTATPTLMPSPTATSTGACMSNCLRSTDIALAASGFSRVTVNGNVTVKDENGVLVSAAQVQVTWTRPDGSTVAQTATTTTSGTAAFSTTGGRGTYTLKINNITKTGYTFDAANSVVSKSVTR